MPRDDFVDALAQSVLAAEPQAIGRALTCLERGGPAGVSLSRKLFPYASGRARVVGLTGPPGAGKSTLLDRLISLLRERGQRVAVLAVDPSSPFTGGAVLGDRVRMREQSGDDVFFRSVASRGQLGGLAPAVRGGIRVLDAAGFDTILIETVGVGQSEIDISGIADCCIVLATPGAGDSVQLMKAGLLETGDVYAVNRADLDAPGATRLARDLRAVLGRAHGDAPRLVLPLSAHTGEGVPGLLDAIFEVLRAHEETGSLAERRRQSLRKELIGLVVQEAQTRAVSDPQRVASLVEDIFQRATDPLTAARSLLGLSVSDGGPLSDSPTETDRAAGQSAHQG